MKRESSLAIMGKQNRGQENSVLGRLKNFFGAKDGTNPTEKMSQRHPEISLQDEKNLYEKAETYRHTLQATEKIRKKIDNGTYDWHKQPTKTSYFSIHREHVEHNPIRAYFQDETPKMGSSEEIPEEYQQNILKDWVQAGQLRTRDVSVGSFVCVKAKELPQLSERFFASLDILRKNQTTLQQLDEKLRLRILHLVDQFLTITHLPINASGRTNEDFLVLLAHEWGMEKWSVSKNGFRGQILNDIEVELEDARWKTRLFSQESNKHAIDELLQKLEATVEAVETQDSEAVENTVTTLLFPLSKNRRDLEEAAQEEALSIFKDLLRNEFVYIEEMYQEPLALALAHLNLYKEEKHTFYTNPDDAQNPQREAYLNFHFFACRGILQKLESAKPPKHIRKIASDIDLTLEVASIG